jgi:hypothetical protein
MSRVRALAEVILTNPKYVRLNPGRAREVAEALKDYDISIPRWDFDPRFHPQVDDFESVCLFNLFFNAINYCYFDEDGKKFQDGDLSGSSLVCARLTEHWEEIKDPYFLSQVDENYLLCELFHAERSISMVRERVAALREVGDFLNKNIDFTFTKLFQKYKQNAYLVSQYLPVMLPTWRDPFFKRSQLFVGMTYGRFQDWVDCPIDDESLSDLTIFADYRVPQTLIAMGVIEPRSQLLTRLHRMEFLASGSQKELELRAASIIGADLITENLKSLVDESVNSLNTDFLLWSASKRGVEMPAGLFTHEWPNHHYTMTTDY